MQHIAPGQQRIRSIDFFRGFIMLIMALDHVRDYFHEDALIDVPTNLATTTPTLFFTRWITHFCAPMFLFLSGVSAHISGQKKSTAELSTFLVKRGVWLILIEAFVFNLVLTFNPAYNIIFLTVFWAIGWAMVILGLLIRTSLTTILVVGVIIVAGHNITDYFKPPGSPIVASILGVFVTGIGTAFPIAKDHLVIAGYAILPWTGIMLLGYWFGKYFRNDVDVLHRRNMLRTAGLAITGFFLILRIINVYGDPVPWTAQRNIMYTVFSFLNTSKYPVSLQFTCMILGPSLLALSFLENARGSFVRFATVYGRVPFFYFIGHFFVAHVLCVIAFFATGYTTTEISHPQSPFLFRPPDFGFSLAVTYLIWIAVVLLMYYPCKWFGEYKQRNRHWWLSYV
ncbi:MAG: DUF1624 domain-containing protein [Chitinophagaceae bacterium]|nr:DUF1624 domain-containing protein [Chitinophagaceae bacterium]